MRGVAFVQDVPGGLTRAAEGECDIGTVELCCGFAGELDEGGFLGGGEGYGFAVGAGNYDCT